MCQPSMSLLALASSNLPAASPHPSVIIVLIRDLRFAVGSNAIKACCWKTGLTLEESAARHCFMHY